MAQLKSVKTNTLNESSQRKITWVFALLFFAFFIGIIVIMIVAIENSKQDLPDNIDVVLFQDSDTIRSKRTEYLAKAMDKYMGFAKNVFVLSSTTPAGRNDALGVTFVKFTPDPDATFSVNLVKAFESIPNIPNISDHAIFLTDQTVPFQKVYKTYLFYDNHPRLFNFFRNASVKRFFENYFENSENDSTFSIDFSKGYDTIPAFVFQVDVLKTVKTLQTLLFREVTEQRLVLREDLNRDVFVNGGMLDNAAKQFKKVEDDEPLFVTFHMSGDKVAANNSFNTFLKNNF